MFKKNIHLIFLFMPFGLVSCQTGNLLHSGQPVRDPAAVVKSETQGPIDDCLDHSYLYARFDGLTSQCTLNYVHYYSEKPVTDKSAENKKLRIGSFNLFHLGDNQSSLKNFTLTAEVMNQWDIVGAQELMPLATEQAISNHTISNLIMESGEDNDFVKHKLQVDRPGYLMLLNELRKLDSSWALILQSMPEGDGSSGEMAGFYYRKSVVKLREWDYCPAELAMDLKNRNHAKNYACLVQLPREQMKLVSRRAFTAFFQSNKFDFIGLTAHVRFRPANLEQDLKKQADELCKNYENPKACKPTKDNIGRYYEVKAITEQIDSIQKVAADQDVIYMGDFNLEINEKTKDYWKATLKSAVDFEVFQTEPTTLAVQRDSVLSNYDHFIFNPKVTSNCDVASIKAYNFTAQNASPSALEKKIAAAADPENIKLQIEKRMSEIGSFAKAKVAKDNSVLITNLDEIEIQEYRSRFNGTVKRMKANNTGALLELISDHIPIEMECKTDKD